MNNQNPIRRAFEPIQAEPALKIKTAAFVHTALHRRKKLLLRRAALACSIVLVVGMVGLFSYFTPASAISIDVNPSLELKLNIYSRVIEASAYNQDAAQLLEQVDLSNLRYTDAIEKLMDSAAMVPYLSDGADVEVTVGIRRKTGDDATAEFTALHIFRDHFADKIQGFIGVFDIFRHDIDSVAPEEIVLC